LKVSETSEPIGEVFHGGWKNGAILKGKSITSGERSGGGGDTGRSRDLLLGEPLKDKKGY